MPKDENSLYAYSEAYKAIAEMEDMSQEEFNEYAGTLELDIANKGGDGMKFLQSIQGQNAMIDVEIKRLQALKAARTHKAERFKEYIKFCMQNAGLKKIETPLGIFSLRKSTKTIIPDETLLPKEYMREKVTVAPDKTAIKKALTSGEKINGALLREDDNLIVK